MPDKLGDEARLMHILDAVDEIQNYVGDYTFEQFKSDSKTLNASIRQLEIIGEACNRLSQEILDGNSDIPWRQIIGLRNILVHQYFGVDPRLVWDVIENELDILKERVFDILN